MNRVSSNRSSRGTLAKKLALKPGQRFLLLGAPERYEDSLGALPKGVTLVTKKVGVEGGEADAIQIFVDSRKELESTLPTLRDMLNPGGMIWVAYPKTTSKVKGDINRDSIREYSLTVGLEAVAIISVDADWSALRLKAT